MHAPTPEETSAERIVSPCVRMCCLDEQDVCLGCFRSLEEIRNWQASDNAARAAVLQRSALRRDAHALRFPPRP